MSDGSTSNDHELLTDAELDKLPIRATSNELSLAGSRAVVFSHVAMEMLRQQLYRQVGGQLARAVLAQAGHQAGYNDAQMTLQEYAFDEQSEMVRMGFRFLSASGYGSFEPLELVSDLKGGEFYARIRCRNSHEGASHLRLFGKSEDPACCHLVGYTSGWASALLGRRVLTVESECIAKGDAWCELETMPYEELAGPEANFWKEAFEDTSTSMVQQLEDKLQTINSQMETIVAQKEAISELSSPVIEVWPGVLCVPVVGIMDTTRSAQMTDAVLKTVSTKSAECVILDITGIDVMDTRTADHFLKMAKAIRLLGAHCVLTGISPSIATTIVDMGFEMTGVSTRRSLGDALQEIVRTKLTRSPTAKGSATKHQPAG